MKSWQMLLTAHKLNHVMQHQASHR